MSKRFYPQQQGDRKRARLDISISDHNFPLSQNKEPEENWGDDNDDEILLLASQACEEVYNNDISLLPEYSMFMQPGSSSTQLPSTSSTSTDFTFKKPTSAPTSITTTNLKEKCNRISSPLPGLTANVKANLPRQENYDKIYKNDSDHVYRQFLQLQEENEKLKSENGKLLEKCVTKEGEASILRTQLKTCQLAVDNARLEKIKAQEKVQMEWTDKLTVANNQMHDLRTQLDFKNLEIISIKEKCKKLESTKVRLTQVTIANNDISSSHRVSTSFSHNESLTQRRVKTTSNAVQTEDKAHLLKLTKTARTKETSKTNLLSYILEAISTHPSILDNEKIQTEPPHKCRVYNTFHRVPSNNIQSNRTKVTFSSIYADIVKIVDGSEDKELFYNVFTTAKEVLYDLLSELETIKQRMTTPFQKEMDEKYIESTSSFVNVSEHDLLSGKVLYKEEQGILARRMVAVLCYIERLPSSHNMLHNFECSSQSKQNNRVIYEKIYQILADITCGTLYSGLLLSIIENGLTFEKAHIDDYSKIAIKCIIESRPMGFVSVKMLEIMANMSFNSNFEQNFCARTNGNLKMDYDQGVLLYKKDSCSIQILLKQIEACLKCIHNQRLLDVAADVTRHLLVFHNNYSGKVVNALVRDKSRCECQLVLMQVLVYALRLCAEMLQHCESKQSEYSSLSSVCRVGVHTLFSRLTADVECAPQLGHNEADVMHFCRLMNNVPMQQFYASMLSELCSALHSSPEEMPPSFHRQPWLKSFHSFSITD